MSIRVLRRISFAVDAELYFKGENPTINRYEKIIYDLQGRAHRDMYTANHKIASSFFGFDVRQEVSYLLGNGVTFQKEATKKRLGKKFDLMMVKAARYALISWCFIRTVQPGPCGCVQAG